MTFTIYLYLVGSLLMGHYLRALSRDTRYIVPTPFKMYLIMLLYPVIIPPWILHSLYNELIRK